MVAVAPRSQACAHIGGDQVVGLEAGLLDAGQVEGAHRLADQRELRDQVVRRSAAGAPCSRGRARCGRCLPIVEDDREMGRPLSAGSSRASSFHSMLQKPSTALTGRPSDLRVSGGSA